MTACRSEIKKATGDEALVARYEELRECAVEQRAVGSRLGLALLVREGVSAWMKAWSNCAATVEPTGRDRNDLNGLPPFSDEMQAGLVAVWTSMALSSLGEASA